MVKMSRKLFANGNLGKSMMSPCSFRSRECSAPIAERGESLLPQVAISQASVMDSSGQPGPPQKRKSMGSNSGHSSGSGSGVAGRAEAGLVKCLGLGGGSVAGVFGVGVEAEVESGS